MSEVQKPVEAPVAAPEVPAVEQPVEPKVEAPVETTADTPIATTEVADETAVTAPEVPAKEEAKPVEEGVLGYKGPGLLKSFIFQKKFFWFGAEPVESKSLTSYLRGEKPDVGNHNAAWASSTGKGLLFFSKKATDKASPAGIINLSEAKDLTEDGTVDFHFTIGAHKHTFQASTLAERDNWVAVLKTKIAEATELATTIKDDETYKSTHTSLSPAVAAVAAPKKSTELKKEDKAEAKEEKKEEKAEAKEEKKEEKAEKKEIKEEKKEEKAARKSRSASRKRTSIFGSIFPKKDETTPATKEEVAAATDATPAVVEPTPEAAPVEATPAATEPVTEAPVVAAPVAAEPVAETKAEEKPKPVKRASIFGNLSFNKKKPEAEAPVVPAKDEPVVAEPVSETAPVIPAVESTEPLATTEATPAVAPTDATPAVAEPETETPAATKRKSSLPFGFGNKKEKVVSSDDEAEKPLSPFAKLRATVKGKKAEKAEKADKTTPEKTPEPISETKEETPAAAATAPVVSEPVTAAPTSTPAVSATA